MVNTNQKFLYYVHINIQKIITEKNEYYIYNFFVISNKCI